MYRKFDGGPKAAAWAGQGAVAGDMTTLVIIVGTESGNAQMVAEILQETLAARGLAADLVDDGDADAARLGERDLALVCTSTHGLGELPDNLIPLYETLQRQRPNLSHLRYGIIALGDQTYGNTFCNAGKMMDALLRELGAVRIGERLEIDACTQPLPDEDALAWLEEWAPLVEA